MKTFCLVIMACVFTLNAIASETPPTFSSTYAQWKDPANSFISYISDYNQARVIFCGSEAYSEDGNGQIPTVSEGMGYGLLLAYANDDQTLFDQFLRYIIATANNYGCGLFDGTTNACLADAPYLMPWIVNDLGQPFWYMSSPTSQAYFSSGSATDADLQIAWAIYLAAQAVNNGKWQSSTFQSIDGTLSYAELFEVMGKAIRLSDVDLDTLRFTPGNQWGAAGAEVLYCGYFTPQAFDALATLPLLDLSNCCPQKVEPIQPASSFQLFYKNNLSKTISIDYMGSAGTLTAGSNFVPKQGSETGFTVASVTTAKADSTSSNVYYNNFTFQATYYDESGAPALWANYYFEYNTVDNVLEWRVTDNGSSPEAKVCLSDNVAHVFLTEPGIASVNFDWNVVKINSLLAIQNFQEEYQTGLFPNTVFYDGDYPNDTFNLSFAYDAIRFPLWSAPYAYVSNTTDTTSSLQRWMLTYLLDDVAPFIQSTPQGNSLPDNGIEVFSQTPLGGYASAPPALNGPIALTAYLSGDSDLYGALVDSLTGYQILDNQPESTDPTGDSSPYFNAIMLLLTEAFFSGKL